MPGEPVVAGESDAPRAAAVAAIAAATSAVLLAMPFERGSAHSSSSRAFISGRPSKSRVDATARRALGALAGPCTDPEPWESSTTARDPTSIGQVTITAVPSRWPWANSPQVPGAQAAPRPIRCAARHGSAGDLTVSVPSRDRPDPCPGDAAPAMPACRTPRLDRSRPWSPRH